MLVDDDNSIIQRFKENILFSSNIGMTTALKFYTTGSIFKNNRGSSYYGYKTTALMYEPLALGSIIIFTYTKCVSGSVICEVDIR